MFVWAWAFCGIRYGCSASLDCSGVIRKINARKIRLDQGVAHACHHDGFRHVGTIAKAPGTVQSPGVRADAQCCKIDILKWLEELVSQSNTIQAQEDITVQGRLQARSGRNYM